MTATRILLFAFACACLCPLYGAVAALAANSKEEPSADPPYLDQLDPEQRLPLEDVLDQWVLQRRAEPWLCESQLDLRRELDLLPVFAALREAQAPATSGDALFDRFAAELWTRTAAYAYVDCSPETLPVTMVSVLPDWEAEFGGDPRFWQLQAFCALQLNGWDHSAKRDQEATAKAIELLEAGLARGASDAATLQGLFDLHLRQLRYKAGISRGKSSQLPPESAQVLLPLAQRLQREYPDESAGYYDQALLDFELFQRPAALAGIQRGNSAASDSALLLYPQGMLRQALSRGETPGGPLLCGLLLLQQPDYLPRISLLLRHCRIRMEESCGLGQTAQLQPLYEMAQRLAGNPEYPPQCWLAAFTLNRRAAQLLLAYQPLRFEAAQRYRLLDLELRLEEQAWLRPRFELETAAQLLDPAKLKYRCLDLPMPPAMATAGSADSPAPAADADAASLVQPEPGLDAAIVEKLHPLFASPGQAAALLSAEDLPWPLGWAVLEAAWELRLAELGSNFQARRRALQELAQWDWSTLDYIKTPEKLAKEKQMVEFMNKLDSKSEAEAAAELQRIQYGEK